MSQLPRLSGRELVKALGKVGFLPKRQHGSHIILRREEPWCQVVIPDHKERVIVQCGKTETYEIVPAKKISDTDKYFSNPKVLEAIERGREDIKAGRVTRITDPRDLLASILQVYV